MLYLAEVQFQNKGFVGGSKTELKLLASQASDQTWSTVPGNQVITVDTISDNIGKGTLYILNLDDNQQLQSSPELAGARIVNYLRHLSRTLEKSQKLESEIEEWKESLRLQGEQIGLRQNELDQQQQIISQQQQELAQLEEDKEKLNSAWEQLRKEQARSNDSKEKLNALLKQFESSDFKPGNLPDLLTLIDSQQKFLDTYWQQLESEKNSLPNREEELDAKQNELKLYRQELDNKQTQLQQLIISAQSNKNILLEKEERIKQLNLQLEAIARLEQEVSVLADDEDENIDINALENMPLGELEDTVNKLQQETSKLVNFVNLQEEELSLQANEVKEIEEEILKSNEVEKFGLDSELADAREAMKLLNETLVGQRKTLKKQQKTLNEHLKILTRRKGVADVDFKETINIRPLIGEMAKQRQDFTQRKERLNLEVEQLRSSQKKLEQEVFQLEKEYEEQKAKSQEKEKQLLQIYQQITETECNISLLEQVLEPVQERLKTLSDKLQHSQPGNDNISKLVNELQSML